jgi:hypothetical protein
MSRVVGPLATAALVQMSGPDGWNFTRNGDGSLFCNPVPCLVNNIDHRVFEMEDSEFVMDFLVKCENLLESRKLQQISNDKLLKSLEEAYSETCKKVPLFKLVTFRLHPCWDPRSLYCGPSLNACV